MEQAAVIPQNGFARCPAMMIGARRLAREFHQFFDELFCFGIRHALDADGAAEPNLS